MKTITRRFRDLLSHARSLRDARHLVQRSGVRRIDAVDDAAFDREVERILETEPPAPGFGYLFVPKPLSEAEWLARHGLAGTDKKTDPADFGPTEQ